MKRYHPISVALHWIMAIMVLMALIAGKFALGPIPLDDPFKIQAATGHMIFGIVIGVIVIIRLLLRLTKEAPAHAETGSALLDKIGALTHWVLYGLAIVMVASGLGMAISGGFIGVIFGEAIEFLPADLREMGPRKAHGFFGLIFMLLVALHVVAALYHQFFLRDGLFSRMWFGKRK